MCGDDDDDDDNNNDDDDNHYAAGYSAATNGRVLCWFERIRWNWVVLCSRPVLHDYRGTVRFGVGWRLLRRLGVYQQYD